MRGTTLGVTLCLLALPFFGSAARQTRTVPVVLISIDGLKPDHVLEADKNGLKISNLRKLVADGSHASGVTGVLPTVTYPSHTTMVTGVAPARHGIIANSPFDPYSKNLNGWYWYSEDIRVPTLWDACAKAGLTTGNVDWPVSVGANITFNIVQYWRAENAEDRKAIRALSTPGLLAEAERALGAYTDGNDYSIAGDVRRASFDTYVLEKKRPRFHLCYFGSLDEEEHTSGPYSPQTFAILEQLDSIIGQIRAAAEKLGGGRAIVCVVSDHGFKLTDKEVNLNSALHEAGLIELNDQGKVKAWRAFAWYGGGSAGIMLRNENDDEARNKAAEVLNRLASDAASGVAKVVDRAGARAMGGFPDAALVVALKPGYRLGSKLQGPVTATVRSGGTHGYAPDVTEMNSSFFIAGPGIAAGRDLGQIDMRDIAPTLAGFLGVALPMAEGHNLAATLK
ncbi:MAG TPA: ectonucleotide pyrophosphatase/phosphodiesterase [Blastocatellia bacterium]|nr:ectonucleotide pyrophosphatase/phosphodiesterase [Blastocatellia bacterium]